MDPARARFWPQKFWAPKFWAQIDPRCGRDFVALGEREGGREGEGETERERAKKNDLVSFLLFLLCSK